MFYLPKGDNSVRVAIFHLDRESSCQAKVGQFQNPLLGDQNVGRLHVPMKDLVDVDVVETLEDLLHHLLDFSHRELHADVAEQSRKIMLAKFEDQIEGRLAFAIGSANLDQIDNILVFQLLQNANFSEKCEDQNNRFVGSDTSGL